MISLPYERVGPYLRALRAGLSALAPNTDHPDPLALDTHLQALDPSLSTTLLLPARLDPGSGLPDATWMDRARAEVAAAQHVRPTEPARIDAIRAADPELAERLTGRSKLLAWLATRPLAPDMWVEARLVRRGEGRAAAGRRVRVTLDRRVPRVGWVRLRVDVDDPAARGAVVRAYTRQDGVDLEPGFAELLARHVVSPLAGLHEIIRSATDLRIHRLSRGILGPFWFPGGPEVAEAPAWVAGALVLHQGLEVIGEEVRARTHHDPFTKPLFPPNPNLGTFRSRHLAVSAHRLDAARTWFRECVGVANVVGLTP